MEEKNRFELDGEFGIIHDTSPNAECMLLNKFQTCEILNQQDKEIKQLNEIIKANIINADKVEKENQQLKIENETLKEKISTQLQNNADNVDFMENQRKEIERLKEKLKDIKNNYRRQIDSLLIARLNLFKQLKQSQKQLAISELKKLKDYFCEEYVDDEGYKTNDCEITKDGCEIANEIDNQIKDLEKDFEKK